MTYDVAVVGMGVVGLAHAYAAARSGARVVVIDREPKALGASIRNFGFITVSGQARGEMWSAAMRSRDIWEAMAPEAGIPIVQRGLSLLAHRVEAERVLEAFLATEMGAECELLSEREYRSRFTGFDPTPFRTALLSPHELRVEPRTALPALARWLHERWKVKFRTVTACLSASPGGVETSSGPIEASIVFICPGGDLSGLFPETLARRGVTRCKLQMLRLRPNGMRLPTPVMADLSLARYEGYAELEASKDLLARLKLERREAIDAGVHLIVVQSEDGSIVVGDSHVYTDAPDPFQSLEYDHLILQAFSDSFESAPGEAIERWTGVYPWSPQGPWFSEEVASGVHMTVVTCGAGMSTAFALAETVVSSALQTTPGPLA